MIQSSITAAELVYLLKHQALSLLLIDLTVNTSIRISCSKQVEELAGDLTKAPNVGSWAYALTLNKEFMQQLALKPLFIVVYDEENKDDGLASLFVKRMHAVVNIMGADLWKSVLIVSNLNGGLN